MNLTTSVCRGFWSRGHRCRTPAAVTWPLALRRLDASGSSSRHTVRPFSSRGYERYTATERATPAVASAARGPAPAARRPFYRPDAIGGIGGQGQTSLMFSTSAADAGATSEGASGSPATEASRGQQQGGSGAESQEGAAAEGGEAIPSPEENPLEGMVADDGDPGPPPPLDPSIVTGPSPKVLEILEGIESLNFVEMAMLIEVFKNKLGLEEVPTLNFEGGGDGGDSGDGGGGDASGAPAEKTIFKVKVTGFGDKAKIKVIKEVRAITGLGLREAKEMVESLPQVVKEDLKQEEAEALKATLEAAGATVELE